MSRLLILLLLVLATTTQATDYAEARHVSAWWRHPVYGDPSFDAFERRPGNPIHRGSPPFEWPVNGFLFEDPVSEHWFIYVGEYGKGYLTPPSRCLLYRSTDRGASWSRGGVVLEGNAASFDRQGHTPDVSVVYADGRYHMVYDWGEPDFTAEGGLAYAWAERPEGPWHRAAEPITRNSRLPKLLGRYQRTYAATLLRRRHDWLILGMMDRAPQGWALFALTAPRPEGPWSERRLVRHVEVDEFHPPLLEFFPAFAHRGYAYAPATAVALNRNFNALFRADLEKAHEPEAWRLFQHGSLWHAEDVEHKFHDRLAIRLERRGESLTLGFDGRATWSGLVPASAGREHRGVLGWRVAANTHLTVPRFSVVGKRQTARISLGANEALLGAAEAASDWEERKKDGFRFGRGCVSRLPGARAKWNVIGRQLELWSPRGPDFGEVEVRLDGRVVAKLDLRADTLEPSRVVWQSTRLRDEGHALVLTARQGRMPVDSVDVLSGRGRVAP